jgi:hypothetical protein
MALRFHHVLLAAPIWALLVSPSPAQPFCSVFDDQPCAPSFCSVYGPVPCLPDFGFPIGQTLSLTIQTRATEESSTEPAKDKLDAIRDVFAALRACWTPPTLEEGRAGMEVSVRLSFNRSGAIIGTPRFTYTTRGASQQHRDLYRRAVVDSLVRCTPLPLTKGLGGAIAGRPIAIRYVDDRTFHRTGG